MKMSKIKEIKSIVGDFWREVLEEVLDDNNDFEVGNYRFISSEFIDEIMCEELSNDEYILGCFCTWFLSDILEIDQDVIDAMKEAEAFEAIGKLVISLGKLEDVQQGYVSNDGYGNHFAHYAHEENEIHIDGKDYYYFRVN